MSYPILYKPTETEFDHNGIGVLSSCISCEVTEEANGVFELVIQYPINGLHFSEIEDRSIIKCRADQFRNHQLFRVYATQKTAKGIAKVYAQHISYDLSGIPVSPFTAETVAGALNGLKNNAVVDCPFIFWTDKDTNARFNVNAPASIRSRLGGVQGGILDVYGGEYEFDNYTVKLHKNRGLNRGVSIRYGKNLTDLKQDQNCSNVATGVYPYWVDFDGKNLVELPEKIINAPGTYNFVKIRTLDLSAEFETQPTVEQLRSRAENYIKANNIGIPTVSLTVSFEQLSKSEEYKHLNLLERISLFDTVNVEFPALSVSSDAKVVKVVYDALSERMKSVTLGSVRANIADTIANQQQQIQQTPTKSDLRRAQESATAWLTNGKGYAYFRKDDFGNIIDILFMDTQDVDTAINVMRVGQSGIGFSHNGVNGPYESAWTIDGNFVADFITTGTLDASLLKTGSISSSDGKIAIDLSGNKGASFNSGVSTNGFTVRADEAGASNLFSVRAIQSEGGLWFCDLGVLSTTGTDLVRIVETFSPDLAERIGVSMRLQNQDKNQSVIISAGDGISGLTVLNSGQSVGSLQVTSDGRSELKADRINGSNISWKYIDSLGRRVLCEE